jgi:DNA-binding beta-propeller fold protein YncE
MFSKKLTTTISCVLAAIAVLAASATPALAESHPFLFSFGSFSNPNGIAVQESTGDVYVADIGTDTIYKFDANGSPVDFSALGSNALTGDATPAGSFSFPATLHGTPAAIAVDASTDPSDPSAGDLYVMDAGHDVIDKFNSKGEYVGQIAGPFLGELLGIGVEANGDVRVDVDDTAGMAIDVFDDSVQNNYVTLLETGGNGSQLSGPEDGFAAGPSGADYLLFHECGCMEKAGPNVEEFGRVDRGTFDVAAAVDPVTGHLYVDEQLAVTEWDPGEMNGKPEGEALAVVGGLVATFGSLQLSGISGQGGIAVDGGSGEIYVSNPADGKVYVFSTTVPAVAAATATGVTQTAATLNGAVDPRGGAISSCKFEYGTTEGKGSSPDYEHTTECEPAVAQIGSGHQPVAVKARAEGLQAGLLYHYRLTVENANGPGGSTGLFATAGPGFGVKTFEVSFLNKDGTPDTQAGSHPYKMVTNIALNTRFLHREPDSESTYTLQPDGNAKDIVVDLPPGLVGDPNATAKKCTLRQLDTHPSSYFENECPVESEVGELEAEFGDQPYDLAPIKEPIYNMVPPRGVAAQFGAAFAIPNTFIDSSVRAGGDYPVQAATLGVPAISPLITTRLTIFGVPPASAEPRTPLLTLPTACNGPLKSEISADSYQEPGHFVQAESVTRDAAGESVALTGCSQLEFPPTITVTPDVPDASSPTGLTVGVHVSQKAALNPEGLAESALRDTTVTLPEGVAINPAGANGLEACSEALAGFTGLSEFNSEFEPGNKTVTFTPEMPASPQPGVNICSNGSKIGTVKIKTPLLEHELEGAVYLAAQNANPFGSLVAMYIFAEEPVSGTIIKLAGEVRLGETGQIMTTFTNTPELPFEDLEIHFFGGERAPLTTPSRCGTYTTQASFVPWDGNGPVNTTSSFQITAGPNGGPCPGASLPFAPSLTAGATNVQAGAFSPFTMTMSREDGNQNLQAISLQMPPGLSGMLSEVKLCGEAEANAGTCGPESEIGETVVSVGVGGEPFTVKGGKVFLTGAYRGAPFGLSIVNPAVAGPYNLGQVVVRAKIEVNPLTAQLTVTSDDEGPYRIPQYLKGIPLQIKHINVTINRPDFIFNPTDCNPLSIAGNLSSTEGALSVQSVPFQATNCAALAFKPKFSASTSGRTSRRYGASLDVKLTYPLAAQGSQANLAKARVELPKKLPSQLKTLRKACLAAVFAANPATCPSASRVGSAIVHTPVLPVALTGPAYFVSNGSLKFPELIIVLQGDGVTIDLHGETSISKNGITTSTFSQTPDVPFSSFELKLPEGPYAALAAIGNLCEKKNLGMPTELVAQDGARIKDTTKVAVTGCPKARRARSRRTSRPSRRRPRR